MIAAAGIARRTPVTPNMLPRTIVETRMVSPETPSAPENSFGLRI